MGACVADRGVQGEGKGSVDASGVPAGREEGYDLRGVGGTGVRYLSLGLRVKAEVVSELLRLCPSRGTSRTLRR